MTRQKDVVPPPMEKLRSLGDSTRVVDDAKSKGKDRTLRSTGDSTKAIRERPSHPGTPGFPKKQKKP